MPDVVDLHYTPGGFYHPGPGDRDYGKGARPVRPDCSLPRWGGTPPAGHVPSTVVACFRLPDGPRPEIGQSCGPRWLRVSRVECACGRAWGRTVLVGDRRLDDVSLRGDHANHARTVRRRLETQEKAA